jgi:acetylglutamate kinase
VTTTVVKLGGSLLDDAALRGRALRVIAHAANAGDRMILVHGGGKRIDANLAAAGIPKRTHAGLRITDASTLDIVVGTLAGVVNKSVVGELSALGVPAFGLSGADDALLQCRIHPPIDGIDLGFVGQPARTNPHVLTMLLDAGYLPVTATIGITSEGQLLNVNADVAAAAIAAGIGAERLIFLTDVDGVRDGNGQVVPRIDAAGAATLVDSGVVTGGMRPKLDASIDALRRGVTSVVIAGPDQHASALIEGTGGTDVVAA